MFVQTLPAPDTSSATAGDEHVALFNRAAYHRLTLRGDERYERIELDGATLCGVRDGDTFHSGRRAPYGGLDLVDEHCAPGTVDAAIGDAVGRLHADGVRTIRIACRAPHHGAGEALTHALLLSHGFVLEQALVNQHVALDGFASADDWLAALKPKRARALRHDLADPALTCDEVAEDDLAGVAAAHAVLTANRAERGRTAPYDAAYLIALRTALPGSVRVLLLRESDTPIAAALLYRVAPQRALVAWWGDAGHERRPSPMKLLALRTVEAALADGARTLDLGPSADEHGVPSPGLIQFKREILGREELRPTFVWRCPA